MGLKIYNKSVNAELIKDLIVKIKSKKELANLDEKLCLKTIKALFRSNTKLLKKFSEAESFDKIKRSKEADLLIKEVRKKVRSVYGLFQTNDLLKANVFLNDLKKELANNNSKNILKIHDDLLGLHVSSKERSSFYSDFYEKLFEITGKPKSILDIASGFNAFSIHYMHLDSLTYVATELNSDDCKLLKKYFKLIESKYNINGSVFTIDLITESDKLKKFAADVLLALKVFDLVPTKITEKIIKESKCNWLVISFPTKTVTKLNMRFKRRAGFQKMLRRIGLKYKTIEFKNELVYLINKQQDK